MPVPGARPARGFTLLEVTLAMFVLVFGLLGVFSLFPVGLDAGRQSIENTNAALIGQSAIDYLQVDPEVDLRWPTVDEVPGSAYSVPSTVTGRLSSIQLQLTPGPALVGWHIQSRQGCVLMITTGPNRRKVYEITGHTAGASAVTCQNAIFDSNDQGSGDYIAGGEGFVILAVADIVPLTTPQTKTTIPTTFFAAPSAVRTHIENYALDFSTQFAIPATPPTTMESFAYVCLLSGRVSGSPDLARADILVFRNYDTALRPERNEPPVGHFVTYLSRR